MPPYTIIGTPFSTFTRTITLGLCFKGIPYEQVRVTPHSPTAYDNHPFGFLPTLVIHGLGSTDVKLRESQAIARYIDRAHPEPSLELAAGDGCAEVPEKMWEFVSLVASFGFPKVEIGVVKHRVKAMDEGTPNEAELQAKIKEGVAQLKKFFTHVESLMAAEGFVYGSRVTWADFFLFPLLADLRATPEKTLLSERMTNWLKSMDDLKAVKETTEGTLSVGARP